MARSGSTVAFNIVCDLLDACEKPYAKYYSGDFSSSKSISDHVNQNEKLSFLIKTHKVDKILFNLSEKDTGKYIYTKRNIFEVSASIIRMSKIKDSPFYKEKGISLYELLTGLEIHVSEYNKRLIYLLV
ncbi:hypothetical protein G3480_13005 [Thiorhodococcus mannitoliphagus]|uniref:Sulfotransferase domain-containing protein n=1 Tax=Thiorhodococcus mannitoliphagus TaxID=329406 RepID=A0A6P1DYI8_9GAMM|nr:hypothetical protein [Thiorhodococcus mannitoliphagus]NEX21222.1 hypothetical protein [Thiorhodococcus mannitoliphagus]